MNAHNISRRGKNAVWREKIRLQKFTHEQEVAHRASPSTIPAPDYSLIADDPGRSDTWGFGPYTSITYHHDEDGRPVIALTVRPRKGETRDPRLFDAEVALFLLMLAWYGGGAGLNPRETVEAGRSYGYSSVGEHNFYWRRLIAGTAHNYREIDPGQEGHRSYRIKDFMGSVSIPVFGKISKPSWKGRPESIDAVTAKFGRIAAEAGSPVNEHAWRRMLSERSVIIAMLWREWWGQSEAAE